MFVSIIVPVFNSELYLANCLDSVLSQDFTDFELILVDDGSTDSSVQICQEFEQRFEQVRFIKRKSNGGVGAARNTGLEFARGTYVTFLDNDDYWLPNNPLLGLSKIADSYQYPDVITFPTYNFWSNSKSLEIQPCTVDSPVLYDNGYLPLISSGLYGASVWSKFIKRDLIRDNNIGFPDGRRNEDSYFSLLLLYHARKIVLYNDSFYVWRRASVNSQSTNNVRYSDAEDLFWIINYHVNYVANCSIAQSNLVSAKAFVAYLYVVLLSYLDLVDSPQVCDFRSKVFNMSDLLSFGVGFRSRAVYLVSKFLGIKLTSHLLGIAMAWEKKRVVNR